MMHVTMELRQSKPYLDVYQAGQCNDPDKFLKEILQGLQLTHSSSVLYQTLSWNSLDTCTQGRIQDFKLGGGGAHLKKLRRAEGGAKIFGIFRVKNHDFTPKNHIFSNFRGGGMGAGCAPPGSAPVYMYITYNGTV